MNCIGNFTVVSNWNQIGSADYFNGLCTSGLFKVPSNTFGVSYPISGNSYSGVICYRKPDEIKEYIQQHLTTSLTIGKTYYVSFYISLSDRFTMAIKSIGAYLSTTQPTYISNPYISANPQIVNNGIFLTDTVGWTKIEGYFTAQGGEQYITIGNFNSNANTDTLYTGTNDPPPSNPDGAYYYIDSVSLYDSLTYVTNVKELKNEINFNLYPNPNNGSFNLQYKINTEAEFVITDITGRLINHYTLFPSQNNLPIKEEELTAGVYFYYIRQGNKVLKQDKLIIIK